jgi:hypothetical protein
VTERLPRRHRLPAALLTLLLLPACGGKPEGPPLYPVHGQLFVGGKPAEKADVYFHPLDNADPRAPRPHGRVDATGAFRVGTRRSDDGAPAGEYAVTVVWAPAEDVENPPDLLKGRYANAKTSKLRVRVNEGDNDVGRWDLR